MFILLIILVTILIFALRLTLIGTELAGRVALREVKRAKKKENDRLRKTEGVNKNRKNVIIGKKRVLSAVGATVTTTKAVVKSGIRLVIFALQWLRGSLIVMATIFAFYDILIFAIITAGAGGAFVLYYEDSANGKSLVAENSSKDSSSSSDASVDLKNLNWDSITDEGARNLLKEISESWGDEVTDKRAKLILLGATRIGHSTYSQTDSRRGGTADDQTVFDCSSFVGWCYYKSGYTKVAADSTTSSFIDTSETGKQFEDTTADKLIPGDVCLWHKTYETGNANHAGMYVGKDKNGQMMFMHCSSRSQSSPHSISTGVRISPYSMEVFRRFKNW